MQSKYIYQSRYRGIIDIHTPVAVNQKQNISFFNAFIVTI